MRWPTRCSPPSSRCCSPPAPRCPGATRCVSSWWASSRSRTGAELRLAVKLRVQNPNEEAVEYDGAALDLEVNGRAWPTA